MDLKFVPCPYCGQVFTENDDVVVCPDCGTPAHRACWAKEGHCLNESKHAEGFVWEIPYSKEREEAEKKAAEEAAAKKKAAMFGSGADGKDNRPDGMPFDNEYGNYASYTTGDHGEMRPTMRVIGPEETLGDFKVKDYGNAIQKNKNRYIPKFFIMERTKRNITWNYAALFFPTLWAAYRRMYGVALALILLQVIVPLFALDSVTEYYQETYSIMSQYAMSSADQDSSALQEAFEASVEKMPTPPTALQINEYVIFALHILMWIFANTLYKRHVERLLQKAKDLEGTDDDRAEYVRRRGGTSVLSVVLVAAIMVIVINLIASVGMGQGYDQNIAETTTKAAEVAKDAKEAFITLWR